MKNAALPIFSLAFLYLIYERFNDMQTEYFLLIGTMALIPSAIALFYKFKKDKQEGKFSFARQGVSIIFIAGTVIFAIAQQFMI